MKKFLIAVLIILAIPIIGIVTYRALQLIGLHNALSKDIPEMTKEELAQCLEQNKGKFESSSNIIFKYPSILDISGSNEYGKEDKNRFYYITNNKIYLKSKGELDKKALTEIESSDMKFIFENLKFKSIMPMEDSIYFVKASNLAYASGIVYSPIKEKPDYEYLIQLEKIEDRWFYFRFR